MANNTTSQKIKTETGPQSTSNNNKNQIVPQKRGIILIYQKRNDIVCRLIPDNEGGLLPSKLNNEVSRALGKAYDEVIGPLDEARTKISMIDRCIICNLIIGENDEITKCPYCSGLAHRDHMLEYIKVKGQCPSCGKELKRYELV
jgi:predicted RNA-binding Zn-ribbon protein involved in translation (DUF1610 family)